MPADGPVAFRVLGSRSAGTAGRGVGTRGEFTAVHDRVVVAAVERHVGVQKSQDQRDNYMAA